MGMRVGAGATGVRSGTETTGAENGVVGIMIDGPARLEVHVLLTGACRICAVGDAWAVEKTPAGVLPARIDPS